MDLFENPFHVLAATPRDDRRRVMELSDERSLVLDSGDCMRARSELTNPRKRLSAEVAWLPGLSPKNAEKAMSWLAKPVQGMPPQKTLEALSPLVRANLLASGLQKLAEHSSDNVAKWILAIAWAFEEIDPEDLCGIINEEHVVSDFPEVTDLAAVEAEVQERRRHFLHVIRSALDKLPSTELVKAVTATIESATDRGETQGPILIDDLIDSYEVDAQEFLEKEEENIRALVEEVRTAADADRPDSLLAAPVRQLINTVRNWDLIAQPIQVSTKSRGLEHTPSHRVAGLVRGLAIHLFNEHGKLDLSQQLTEMLRGSFAEVCQVLERTEEDADALNEIAEQRKHRGLLEPVSELCSAALEKSEGKPSTGYLEAQRVLDGAPRLISELTRNSAPAAVIEQAKDEVAVTLMNCAVVFGNETRNWKMCITVLEEAKRYASGQKAKSSVQKNLETVRKNDRLYGDLEPISSAPSLSTIHGCGFTLYGLTDHEPESGSYLSTYYFVILAIPLFPIRRYRVIPTGNGYRFLGKAKLRTFDKWHIAAFLAGLAVLVLSG